VFCIANWLLPSCCSQGYQTWKIVKLCDKYPILCKKKESESVYVFLRLDFLKLSNNANLYLYLRFSNGCGGGSGGDCVLRYR
jgi:hypothetical protein